MTDFRYDISEAVPDDIPGILDLQERNLRENGGTLSVRFPAVWFAAALADMPVIAARSGGGIVGYMVSTPLAAQAHVPIIQSMLKAYSGPPDVYNYGPVCIDQTQRGRGLAGAMFGALRSRLPGRQGITFIRADNAASIKAHAKFGMRQIAEFDHAGTPFVIVGYDG